ncbi:MAG: hypothetical protein WBR10_20145 [Candidatus Acidiferrum sp.]
MCPACISTLAIMVAGAMSSGGVTAVVVNKFRALSGAKSGAENSEESTNQKEEIWEKRRTSR